MWSTKTTEMKTYPTDLTDSQWQVIQNIQNDNRKRRHNLRGIWDAIFYILSSGCQWRMLPSDFAPWSAVYYYFAKWKNEGIIESIHDQLRENVRRADGRNIKASVAILDSQSTKNTACSTEHVGYDAAKRIKGRKRHIAVDTMGLLLLVVVHSAGVQDTSAASTVLKQLKYKYDWTLTIFADAGYKVKLQKFVKMVLCWTIIIVKRTDKSFKVLPKRWIVERTFAWIGSYRRNSKDYERLVESSEAMIQLTMIRIMVRRLGSKIP